MTYVISALVSSHIALLIYVWRLTVSLHDTQNTLHCMIAWQYERARAVAAHRQKERKGISMSECPRMTKEQLIAFSEAFNAGDILTHAMVKPMILVPMVFLPLGLSEEPIPEKTGIAWANTRTDSTMGRSINGYLMFSSCRLMHEDDVKQCQEMINKLRSVVSAAKETL